MAARAGIKAAGRNALAGGVILAAIEGLNVFVSRVVFPYLEKQQEQVGMPVDLLEPPMDPLRPYVKRAPLFKPSVDPDGTNSSAVPSSSYLFAQPSSSSPIFDNKGFDTDSASQFNENATDDWESKQLHEAASLERDKQQQPKPFWKIW